MENLTPCKFYIKGSDTPLTYNQMREYLAQNNIVEPIAPLSPLKARAAAIRERANKYRTGGTLQALPNAIATALDVYASILETADTIQEAIKKFRATNEYKALNEEERDEVDELLAEDEAEFSTEPKQKPAVEFEKAEGEKRESSRSKRISANEKYSSKLNSYEKEYTSINSEAVTGLVEQYFDEYVRGTEGGLEDAIEYAGQLIIQDSENAVKGIKTPYTKSAFAALLLQKVISEAQLIGDISTATKANDVITNIGRFGGTVVALQQAGIALDAVGVYLPAEAKKQDDVLKETTKSGRTKKEVVEELKKESDKARAKAVDEATESEAFDTTVSEPKAPTQSKKANSKKAALKKREQEAKAKIKAALASRGVGGPLMAMTPKNAQILEGILELARVKIEQGAYSFGEVVKRVSKDLQGLISEKEVRESILENWDAELSPMAEKERQNEAAELLKDAIEGNSSDASLKALAKAIRMLNKEVKGKRLTDKQIVEEILKNKEKAEMLLTQALGLLSDEVNQGKLLNTITATKPKNMTNEQWDAFRKKAVIARYKQFINELLGKAKNEQEKILLTEWLKAKEKFEQAKAKKQAKEQEKKDAKEEEKELEEREKLLKEAEAAWNKEATKAVREVAKKFYKEPNSNQTFQEALAEAMPQLTPQQVLELAEKVVAQVNKILDANDNRRIKELFRELTDGKDDANIERIIAKTLWSRGAVSQFGFTNLLAEFLGYKGVPQHAIAQLTQLLQQAAKLPAGQLRQQIITQANTIASSYNETAWAFLLDTMREVLVRNLLSKFKTLFTGGFSMYLSLIPQVVKKTLTNRPIRSIKAQAYAWKSFFQGRYGVRKAFKESFVEHNDPFALEVGKSDNLFSKERAWQRARKAGWKDIQTMWASNKGKGAALAFGRMLTEATFQGKVPLANIVPDLMAFLNFVGYQYAKELNVAYEAQDKLAMQGIKPSDAQYKDMFLQLVGLGKVQQAQIEAQIDSEIQQAASLGIAIPKDFRKTRYRQLVKQAMDESILSKSADQAIVDIALNEPRSFVGARAYSFLQKMQSRPETQGQLSMGGFFINMFASVVGLFSKQAIVLAERAVTMTPIIGTASYLTPYNWEIVDGKVRKKRDDNGMVETWTKDKTEVAYRVLTAGAVIALWAYILQNWWDDEEVKDAEGNVVVDKETGKPLIRKKWALTGKVEFYGSSKEFGQDVRGEDPRNAIVLYNEDGTPQTPIPFETLPLFFGGLVFLGAARDKQRYLEEKVEIELSKDPNNEKFQKKLKEAMEIDWLSAVLGSAVNSANFDFQTIPRLISESKNKSTGEYGMSLLDILIMNPTKGIVNPAIAQSIEQQVYNINNMHKIYVKLEPDIQEMGTYLMKDVWFLDPFIPDRKNYESVDVFGNKIEYPPIFNDLIGSFGNTTNYAMANHVKKHEKQYDIFRAPNPTEEPIKLPTRYHFEPSSKDMDEETGYISPSEKAGKQLDKKIGDLSFENFGKLTDEYKPLIMKTPFETRGALIEYLYEVAKYDAIKEYFPKTKREYPKLTASDLKRYLSNQKEAQKLMNAEALK